MQELTTLEKINNLDQMVHELAKACDIGMKESPEVLEQLCENTAGALTPDIFESVCTTILGYMIQTIDEIRSDYIALTENH